MFSTDQGLADVSVNSEQDKKPTHNEQAFELYTCLMRKGPHAFQTLIEGLIECQGLVAAGILKQYTLQGQDQEGRMETDGHSQKSYNLR
jgi:hypothetical protein